MDEAHLAKVISQHRLHGLYRAYLDAIAASRQTEDDVTIPMREWLLLSREIRTATGDVTTV